MSNSALRTLIGTHLARIHNPAGIIDTSELYVELFDAATAIGAEAVAGCGAGLDHYAGERVLAALLLRDTPKGHEHRLAAAITDSRTLLSGWSSIKGGFNPMRSSIAHAQLTGVQTKDSLLSGTFVTLQSGAQSCKLTFGDATKGLGAFYQAMGQQVPAEARVPPPTDFVAPSEADPSGAVGARERLFVPDEEAAHMLSSIESGMASGQLDATMGVDMVKRIVLAHRTRCGGPGMLDGGWLSPMSAQDFGHSLVSIFGPPMATPEAGQNHCLDFRLDPRRDYAGAALKTLGVASYAVLGIGFSPGKMIAGALMKKAPIRELRFIFGERESACRFTIRTGGVALELRDSMLAHRLHQALLYSSYAVLERRCKLGWGPGYAELFS